MTNDFRDLITIIEAKQGAKIELEKLPYKLDELDPVLSSEAINFHYGQLAKGYVERYNAEEGDPDFNYAGAILHNIYFPQLLPPKNSNKPLGKAKQIIDEKYGSFEAFKEKFAEVAMGIQGSGWVYMSKNGDIKTIKNHAVRNDIAMLVDWWEHAFVVDYSKFKDTKPRYLKNHWRIINWEVVNYRLS